jgi:glucose/arabinose dehydrogenase
VPSDEETRSAFLYGGAGLRLKPQPRFGFVIRHSEFVISAPQGLASGLDLWAELKCILWFYLPTMRVPLLTALLLLAGLAGPATAPGQTALTRVAATSLTLPAAAPATAYSTPAAFAGLTFSQPVAVVSPPGDTRRLFVVEKAGRIWVIPDVTAATPSRTLFLDLTSRVTVSTSLSDERGLLALAFHPDYATNGSFFVWYTVTTTTGAGGGLHNRLSRFRVFPTQPNAADPASEVPLISQRDEASNHNGGQILFGPDGYLYLSLGDEGASNDSFQNSQRIDRDFFAGIVRLDVDQRPGSLPPTAHPSVHPGTYSVPPDNPFVGATTFLGAAVNPAAVRTEFWATGLRNPWRIAFDPANGQLWCADVGQGAREEVNLIVRGGNYGWNYREGNVAGPRSNPPAAATFIAPVWDYPRSAGQSITGGVVSRGARLASLYGHYLFADFASGRVWALRPDGTQPVGADRVQQLTTLAGISSFGVDPSNGDVLIVNLNDGTIRRLVATPATGGTPFPATLTATGAFSSVAALTPAPGLVPYEPVVSFWSDHARKRRWFALTDTTSRYGFSATGNWTLPTGAVWVKHFDLDLTRGNPATARRVETRFLVKTATGTYGLSYRWNDAQTEATLVAEDGADQAFTVVENGVARTQTWRFPSRGECLACHTPAAGHALAFSTRQLNRGPAAPGAPAPLLTAMAQAGYLDVTTLPDLATLPRLAAADDVTASLELRARSHLDANCSSCHQPAGPALGFWDARATTPLAQAGLVNGALTGGAAGPDRVIVPGDPGHSRLLQRMSAAGAERMPPVGTRERDTAGEALLTAWILSLAQPDTPARLLNLSARAAVGTGGDLLITGFVVQGTGSKSLLLRGVGPGLAAFNVAGPLARPTLSLLQNGRIVTENTRWNTAPDPAALRAAAAQAGAFALAEGGADSALLATVSPGSYTAHLRGLDASTGVGLIEVYDLDPPVDTATPAPRLANLSVRAVVGTGENLLIPGLVVGAGTSRTVLVRAVGPGLTAFGVAGVLPDPALELYRGSERIAANTRWNTSPQAAALRAAALQVGAFALTEGGADSALLATLAPGAYTLQVRGAGGGSGVALVEVYDLP